MPTNYTNIPSGLRTQTQIPLDVKQYAEDEATLGNLGIDNNLVYTYTQGLIVYCVEEGTRYEWREVEDGEENTGLLVSDFTYPDGLITFGIDYSNRIFNFFKLLSDAEILDVIEDAVSEIPTDTNNTYTLENVGDGAEIYKEGADTVIGQATAKKIRSLESSDDSLIITQGTDKINLIVDNSNKQLYVNLPAEYELNSNHNNYTLIVQNPSHVSDAIITIPDGLPENFRCYFIQDGEGIIKFELTVDATGVLHSALGTQIVGQYYWAYIEQKGTSNEHFLLGQLTTP
jgi:hypothetical protein